MNKPLKIAIILFPWGGMIIFGFLYFLSVIELGVADHYSNQSHMNLKTQTEQLTDYIKSRRDYQTDELAFDGLGLISSDDYDGKYDPWIITQLGLVRFDSNGFVVAHCFVPAGLNDPECPPNL